MLMWLLAGCGDGPSDVGVAQDAGGTPPASVESPPPQTTDASPVSLWLSAEQVPPGGTEVVAVLINRGGAVATFGVAATVERWDGGAWEPHRQLVMCLDHWHCTATMADLDTELAVPGIGLSATVERPGPVERFSTGGVDVGWYRISQTANEGIVAAGVIEVVGGAAPPAPLVPVDEPSISLSPAVVPPAGGPVTLFPLVPAPSGVQSAADVELAVAGLSEDAAIERWDGGAWVPAGELALHPSEPSQAGVERSATLPALTDGEYRLVRSGPAGDHTGRFWVAST
jgi:hypothetical protein